MTDNGGRKKTILLIAGLILAGGAFFGTYELFKYKFTADEVTGVPTAPTNVTAVDNADRTAVTLSWNDSVDSSATNFRIERSASIWREFEEIANPIATVKTYTDNNIEPGHRYYYRILGYNATGDSAYSNIITPTRVEYKDYLAGIGEMETSFTTTEQRYSAPGVAVNKYIDSTENNAIAGNWMGITQYNLIPEQDYYYKIEDGGIAGTKQQCFGIQNNNKTTSRVYLRTTLTENTEVPVGEFSNDDTVRYVVDKITYVDMNDLPAGASRNIITNFRASGKEYPGTIDLNSYPASLDIETPVSAFGNTGEVNQFQFDFQIAITGSNNLGEKTPGICLDGVHFYVKKAGQSDYNKVLVPARDDVIQKSYLSHAESNHDNPYYLASNYDHVSLAYGEDYIRLPAKYYNPNIKFFVYTARSFSDYRNSLNDLNDVATMSSENKFTALLQREEEELSKVPPESPDPWFYTYDPNILQPPSGDKRDYKDGAPSIENAHKKQKLDGSFLNYVFDDYYQTEYLNNIQSSTYATWWKNETIKMATKRGFDGVFLDVSAGRTVAYNKVNTANPCPEGFPENPRNANQCIVYNATTADSRALLRQVIPDLKANNLAVTMNCAGCHLGFESGDKFFDPWFAGNTESNTPDSHFQEHAFFGIKPKDGLLNRNYYRDVTEWNNTISDMEKYQEINTSLSEKDRKIYYVSSYGFNKTTSDSAGNPADPLTVDFFEKNIDGSDQYDIGWGNHVLASYLLGSNQYTHLSIIYDDWIEGEGVRKEYPLNNNILDRLGQAEDKRYVQYEGRSYDFNDEPVPGQQSNLWDKAVNFRQYENGLVVVNADSGEFGEKHQSHPFVMPDNYIDEYGRKYVKGSTITMQKRTGRIFFKVDRLDKPTVGTARGITYKDSVSLFGTMDIFASSVEVNDREVNINKTNYTWNATAPINIGANTLSVKAKHPTIPVSEPATISITRRKPGDINGDNAININDLGGLMFNYNRTDFFNIADFNEDGSVGLADLGAMMANWGK